MAIKTSTKQHVLERDGFACRYCGQRVYLDVDSVHPARLTYDHVIPHGHGGHDGWGNVVIACRSCNHSKGDAWPEGQWAPLRIPKSPPSAAPFHEDLYTGGSIVGTTARWRVHRQRAGVIVSTRPRPTLRAVPEAFAALGFCQACGAVTSGDHECATVPKSGVSTAPDGSRPEPDSDRVGGDQPR